MTYYDWLTSRIPEYYDTMYLDGYTHYEIMQAAHKSIMRRYNEMMAEKAAKEAENEITNIKITSEVKIK